MLDRLLDLARDGVTARDLVDIEEHHMLGLQRIDQRSHPGGIRSRIAHEDRSAHAYPLSRNPSGPSTVRAIRALSALGTAARSKVACFVSLVFRAAPVGLAPSSTPDSFP